MNIRYIGMFPPPYGGVTIKNKLIFECISENHKVVTLRKPAWMPGAVYQPLNLLLRRRICPEWGKHSGCA